MNTQRVRMQQTIGSGGALDWAVARGTVNEREKVRERERERRVKVNENISFFKNKIIEWIF